MKIVSSKRIGRQEKREIVSFRRCKEPTFDNEKHIDKVK